MTNSMDLIKAINDKVEGEMALTIMRERKQQTVKVNLEKQVTP